jgi:hypothetical protein
MLVRFPARMQRLRSKSLLFVLLIYVCQSGLLSVQAAERSHLNKNAAWVIKQRHHSSGDLQLCFTSDALRIDKTNFGYVLISKAPDWTVYVFRNDDKVMCQLTRQAYLAEQGFLVNAPRINTLPVAGDGYISSVKTTIYRSFSHDDWLAKFPGIPQEIYDLIMATAFYHSEPATGIVLKSIKHPKLKPRKQIVFSLDTDNATGIRLDTLKVSKAPYKWDHFSVPANYRQAKLRTIVTSIASRKEADSIVEQMGLGEKLGNSPRK